MKAYYLYTFVFPVAVENFEFSKLCWNSTPSSVTISGSSFSEMRNCWCCSGKWFQKTIFSCSYFFNSSSCSLKISFFSWRRKKLIFPYSSTTVQNLSATLIFGDAMQVIHEGLFPILSHVLNNMPCWVASLWDRERRVIVLFVLSSISELFVLSSIDTDSHHSVIFDLICVEVHLSPPPLRSLLFLADFEENPRYPFKWILDHHEDEIRKNKGQRQYYDCTLILLTFIVSMGILDLGVKEIDNNNVTHEQRKGELGQ